MSKSEFNLEHQFQLYLERVGLKESQMPMIQRKELQRAFMGACGQMLLLLRDEVGELTEEDGFEAFEDLLNQVGDYWLSQEGVTK